MSKAQQLLKTMQEVKVPQNYEEYASLPGGPEADTITLHVDSDNEAILLMQNGQYVELNYDHYSALRKQLASLIGDGTLEPWPR